MRRLRPPDGSARPRRRRRYELSALRSTPYRPADSSESVPPSDQKHRPPNEGGTIPVPLFAPVNPTRSIDVGPSSICRALHHHRRRYPSCRSVSRTHPRYEETFAGGIDGGTQRTGDQHRNLLASFPSLLDDPAAILADWFILEFASSQRSSNRHPSSLHRLRSYALFAAPDQALAFVLSHVAANRAGELLHAARLGATYTGAGFI